MKLGICLPTNNPDRTFDMFAPTIKNIKELSDTAVFLLNFQPPWDDHSISKFVSIIEESGFEHRHVMTSDWDKPIKFTKMRHKAAELGKECDVFMLCDDDMKFSPGTEKYERTSGERYLEVLDYMSKNPKCGSVQCKSFLGGYHQQYKIQPMWDHMHATDQGLFLRNVSDFLISSNDVLELRGALEESAAIMSRVEIGYYPAKLMNCPTIHRATKLDPNKVPIDDMHHPEVLATNIQKWIRDRYDYPSWSFEKKIMPPELKKLYSKNGGVDITDESLVIDYA